MILTLELINTAIERCVDLVTKEYHDLAKAAKDVAAGAVFIMSMFSIIIGIIIFLPKMINMLGW
jgi:undecaprenol kinase